MFNLNAKVSGGGAAQRRTFAEVASHLGRLSSMMDTTVVGWVKLAKLLRLHWLTLP